MSEHFDIAVVGGGAAGIAAGVAAARAGARTLLLDSHGGAGGTGGFSGLTTLCGLYDQAGHFLNEGISREFAEALAETEPVLMGRVWVLPYRPARFREIASRLLAPVTTRWSTPLGRVTVEDNRITRINETHVGAVIDCTGTAEVARAIGAECLETDDTTQAPAVVFPLRHVEHDFKTIVSAAQVLLPLARAGLPLVSFQPSLEPQTVTVKLNSRTEQALAVVEFLRAHVAGFEHCIADPAEFVLARRAGRMIAGRHVLTGADVLAARKFPDAVARCAWPIEQWNPDGVARFRYLPENSDYDIPARSLQSARIENLWMAGKTISADVDAIASARVMGCCLATGAAAGTLAAKRLQENRLP